MKHLLLAIVLLLTAQGVMAADQQSEELMKPHPHCSAASGACRTGIRQ